VMYSVVLLIDWRSWEWKGKDVGAFTK